MPADSGRRIAAGQPAAQVQVITDGSIPNTATFVAAYAEGVRANWAMGKATERGVDAASPIALNSRFWFNPELASRYFLVPGALAIGLTMTGTLLPAPIGIEALRERV